MRPASGGWPGDQRGNRGGVGRVGSFFGDYGIVYTDERSLKIGRRPRLRSPDCRTGQWKEVMIPITELYKRYNAIQQSIVTDVFNDVRCFFVAAPWRLLSTSVLLALSHVP